MSEEKIKTEIFCMKCRKKYEVEAVVVEKDMRGMKRVATANCPVCGARMNKVLPKKS